MLPSPPRDGPAQKCTKLHHRLGFSLRAGPQTVRQGFTGNGTASQALERLYRHWHGFTGTGTALQAPQQIRNKPKHSKTAQQREEESQLPGLLNGKPGSEHAIRQPQPRKVAFQTSRGVNNCQEAQGTIRQFRVEPQPTMVQTTMVELFSCARFKPWAIQITCSSRSSVALRTCSISNVDLAGVPGLRMDAAISFRAAQCLLK